MREPNSSSFSAPAKAIQPASRSKMNSNISLSARSIFPVGDDGLSCARWAHARVRRGGLPHEICRYAAGGMVGGVGLVKKMLKSLLHSADS